MLTSVGPIPFLSASPLFSVVKSFGTLIVGAMKSFRILFPLVSAIGLVGCTQFEENLREDEYEHTISGLGDMEEEQVNELSESGQLNDYERDQMNEAISGQ